MPTIEELRKIRIQKLETLKDGGKDPFPSNIKRDCNVQTTLNNYWFWKLTGKVFYLVGRIKSIRSHGQAAFFDLEDESGKIQCFLSPKDLESKKSYEDFLSSFDIGDFVEVKGSVFKTNQGEKTIRVKKIRMVTKALRPLPEKWHGLKDIEERYRKRYLDLLMNEDIKKNFLVRSEIIKKLRKIFDYSGFVEVETPVLQSIPGGATAKPFKTRLNALDLDLYLRIAPELYLKQLLVGGFEKIYEIGRNFRNEGMDAYHNPEFTMLEAYIAYKDSAYLKTFLQDILRTLIKDLNSESLVITYENNSIDFSKSFAEKNYNDLIKKFGDLDIAKKTLIQPTFVTGFPKELLPLAKTLEGDSKTADAFQIFVGGLELIKAFAE